MKSSRSSLPTDTSSADAGSPGLGSLARTLAFMSPLMMVGSLVAQETPAATPAPADEKDKDAAAAATPASADTKKEKDASADTVELPVVTVETAALPKPSSPKFTQPLVDTPQTVVVIPAKVYQEQGAKTLQDVLRNTPGISFTASENSGVLSAGSFSMRGTDASNSIFIDGIRDNGVYDRDVFNVEQVEVVKGPTGENGRAQAGGYVNLSTKSPRLDAFQEIGVGYTFDDYDGKPTSRGTIDINQPLGKSPIPGTAFRLNALIQEGGIAGREVTENNKWSVAPSFAFGLGTPTRLILSYQHSEQRNIPDRGLPSAVVYGPLPETIVPNSTVATATNGTVTTTTHTLPFTIFNPDGTVLLGPGVRPVGAAGTGVTVPAGAYLDIPVTLADGTVIPAGTPLPQAVKRPERDTFYGYKSDYEDIDNNVFTARLEHDASPDTRLFNVTRYSVTDRIGFYASPGSGLTAPDLTTTNTVADPVSGPNVVTNSSTIVPYAYVTRGSPSIQNDTTNRTFTNQSNIQFDFDTGPLAHTLSAGLELTREEQHTRNWTTTVTFPGATANTPNPSNADAYDPNYNIVIPYTAVRSGHVASQTDTAALYAYDTIQLHPKLIASLGGRVEHYQTDVESQAGVAVPTFLETDGLLRSYKLGLVFKPVPIGSIYGSYGNSFLPPGSNFTLSSTANNANNPNLDPQEATNAEVGTKWTLFEGRLLASFAIFKSENTNMPVTVTTPVSHVEQTGHQEVQGWEMGLSGNITPEWLVFVGYAKQDAVYSTGQPAGTDLELAANPAESGNIWTSYNFPIGLSVGAGAQYFGESNRRQGSTFTVPAYTLYNAMLGYAVTKNLSVQLNVNNIADKLYVRGQNAGSGTNASSRIYIGDPRTYQLSATYRF